MCLIALITLWREQTAALPENGTGGRVICAHRWAGAPGQSLQV